MAGKLRLKVVNAANIAKQLWCHQYAIFKVRREKAVLSSVAKKLRSYPNQRLYVRAGNAEPLSIVRDSTPLEIGYMAEASVAKQYPTEVGLFSWGAFEIVCAPDGLNKKFVYEFKTVKNGFWATFVKPVARLQAHLYAYLYNRSCAKVEIWIREEDTITTLSEPVDRPYVEERLRLFSDLLSGRKTPIPPKAVKCRSCEFLEKCPITPLI